MHQNVYLDLHLDVNVYYLGFQGSKFLWLLLRLIWIYGRHVLECVFACACGCGCRVA